MLPEPGGLLEKASNEQGRGTTRKKSKHTHKWFPACKFRLLRFHPNFEATSDVLNIQHSFIVFVLFLTHDLEVHGLTCQQKQSVVLPQDALTSSPIP